MSGLPDGKYLIVHAATSAPPPLPVGVNEEGGFVKPVVVGGKNKIWTVRKLENGNYTLALQQGESFWPSKPGGEDVIVDLTPRPGEWRIRKSTDKSYTIEVPTPYWPGRGWTVNRTEPGTKVKLGIIELPQPDNLWDFVRVYE